MAVHCLKLGNDLCFPRRLSLHGVRMDRSQPPLEHHGMRIGIVERKGFERRPRRLRATVRGGGARQRLL